MSSDKTLGRARGLNSIADPADFKGSRGRRTRGDDPPTPDKGVDSPADSLRTTTEKTTQRPNVDSNNVDSKTADGTAVVRQSESTAVERQGDSNANTSDRPKPEVTPHRAVVPGLQRKRRELSVPVPVAEAVAATGINAADIVMTAYRDHSDAVFNGAGGRMVARGRQRLRLSISDAEFDKLTRLGEARGWNRSETVTVLLTLALLEPN